jgi:hypothetical protein
MSVDALIQLRIVPGTTLLEARSYDTAADSVDENFSPVEDLLLDAADGHAIWLECTYALQLDYDFDVEHWQCSVRDLVDACADGDISQDQLLSPEIAPGTSAVAYVQECILSWRRCCRASGIIDTIESLLPQRPLSGLPPLPAALRFWSWSSLLPSRLRRLERTFRRAALRVVLRMVRQWKAEAFETPPDPGRALSKASALSPMW